MSNRLSRIDFFVVFMILLSLACLIGGFFLGINIGHNKAVTKYEQYIAQECIKDVQTALLDYSHTDFVSFYHQVYLPFKEFRKDFVHLEQEAQLDKMTRKDLAERTNIQKTITEIRKEIEKAQIPNTSPLLQESQREFIRALQSYESAFKKLYALDKKNAKPIHTYLQEWDDFSEAKNHWLTGQSHFYQALLHWESKFITQDEPKFIEQASQYTLQDWSELGFHQKNDLIAKLMIEMQYASLFNPEDVLVYLDALARHSNQNKQQKVSDAVQFLIASNSIKEGEFLAHLKEYDHLELPMIPLFAN